jgi:hypothetical protein
MNYCVNVRHHCDFGPFGWLFHKKVTGRPLTRRFTSWQDSAALKMHSTRPLLSQFPRRCES